MNVIGRSRTFSVVPLSLPHFLIFRVLVMGGTLGLSIVYQYACSREITGLPLGKAWAKTNQWSGVGILLSPLFSGK